MSTRASPAVARCLRQRLVPLKRRVLERHVEGGFKHRCTQSQLRGAGLTQLAIECVEFSDALLLALDECLDEVRFGGRQ